MPFPWRWTSGTISTNLDVIWGMSVSPADLIAFARATGHEPQVVALGEV